MQICDKQYQSLNISASPSFATAQGRENERRGWTKETYEAKNKQPGNRYDWSRRHLNFEIKRGRRLERKDGKTHFALPSFVPLGSQSLSLKQRYEQRLKELDYKPWSKDAPNQPNTCVDFVFNGDHDRMTEIAFGKPMDLDWREDNGRVTLAEDPSRPGRKQIETMALDYYRFLCRHFGEENVIGFECHLDETTPHFHALVIPVAMRTKRGRIGGYELKQDTPEDGKERPEHITTRQFTRLHEDEQRLYQPAEKGVVPSVSYSYYFGETRFAAQQSYRHWHTMLADEVSHKWGLERGEDTSLMTAEERKEHRKKSKRQLERERLQALEETEKAEAKKEQATDELGRIQMKLQQDGDMLYAVEKSIEDGRDKVSQIKTETDSALKERDDLRKEKTELEKKVEELANAVGDPKETVDIKGFMDSVFAYNPTSSGVVVANLKEKGKSKVRMMDVIAAAFEEMEKVKDKKKPLLESAEDFRKEQDRDIMSIMTDMQTILRSFDSAHVKELTRRSRAIVKQELRQNAVALKKIKEYDEMQQMGISKESYSAAKEKADKFDKAQTVMGTMWPGIWNVVEMTTDPKLDEYEMNTNQKNVVRNALHEDPKERLKETEWLLRIINSARNIDPQTEAEVWEIGAETGVGYLKRLGLDLADDVAENVNEVSAATACLFFGYLDGATTISESCDGGGGNNELPKKKDDEDELSFAKRCHQMAKAMFTPKYKLKRG